MRVALAHMGTGPFVQQTARGLFEAGLLARYYTTFVDRPDSQWHRLADLAGKLLNVDFVRQLRRRAVTEVPLHLVTSYPRRELLRIFAERIGVDSRLVDVVFDWGARGFDGRVARQALSEADAIYGYEYTSLAMFEHAALSGAARIYEVPSPEHDYVEGLIQREIERFPELDNGKRRYYLARQAQRTERRRKEWNLAQVIIVNSNFTRDSYAAAGLTVGKVRVVPLACPEPREEGGSGGGNACDPLRVLWAGTFGIRKGAHYLLDAWRALGVGKSAVLRIYGAVTLPNSMVRRVPNSITLSPTVPRAELDAVYRSADVLVFPTLCDGFGMVVTEALAQGLPVITTDRAGAADLVRHGENGLIIPAGDTQALTGALEWCTTHRDDLKHMRQAALKTAQGWQWSHYRAALVKNVLEGLAEA